MFYTREGFKFLEKLDFNGVFHLSCETFPSIKLYCETSHVHHVDYSVLN